MKEMQATPPLPDALPAHDFNKLGFVYITVLGLANQVIPHTGSWRTWATAVQPATPVEFQPNTDMSHDKKSQQNSKIPTPMSNWINIKHDVKELDVPVFWPPPTHLTSSHCLV
ncbi:hypothetical protein DSO57_1003915 [Entomophthora muscae]|uniref:Uncharacterized protein n=1 Tax=Entomophthora muscae TaxID=34485 RepID=A0ACC2SA79_9FUNG|nr:hypothetical protein DSO57_1003915 [Entomophthora muscae]